MANFDEKIVNEGVELMVEDVVADGGKSLGTGAAILIGVGLACAVGVGVKLVKKGVEAIKAKKELRLVERGDFVKSEDLDQEEAK